MASIESRPVGVIDTGKRHRKDLGDIKSLANSIREVGLLHPVVVRPDGALIAGERRLEACKLLGWTDVPVHIVSLDDIVQGEFAENAIRKDFLPSEIEAIRRAMAPVETAAAKERQGARNDKAATSAKVSHKSKQRATDKIGAFAGVSGRTVEKIAAVVEAADEDPDAFGPLVEEMDRTGKVDGAYRKLRQKRDERRVLSVAPVAGKFRTLVVDPPWDHEGLSLAGRGRPEYAVMSQEDLLALQVAEWAEGECHLYLWTTNNFLLRAGELIRPWGFEFKTVLTGIKRRIGLGSYFRSATEHVLFAVRGSTSTRVKDIPTWFEFPSGEHSAKPECFYDIVRRASYPPYGEVFQREARADFENVFQVREAAE